MNAYLNLCMGSFFNVTEHRSANHSYVYSYVAVIFAPYACSCCRTGTAPLILPWAPMSEEVSSRMVTPNAIKTKRGKHAFSRQRAEFGMMIGT